MKKLVWICIAAVLMMALCSCQKDAAAQPTLPETAAPTAQQETPPTQLPQTSEVSPDVAMLKAYQLALQQISASHVYPDGTDIGFDSGFGMMEDNRFAICDVDQDGDPELIVSITTVPMADQMLTIYQYDPQLEALRIQLQVFPALTYYTDGIIRADWSHNHTDSMTQWPYDMYVYDPEEDAYISFASVYAWDKFEAETDGSGNPYPQDVDKDNAGTVYCISLDGQGSWVSKAAYESWLASVMGSAEKVEILFRPMTEENIAKVAP